MSRHGAITIAAEDPDQPQVRDLLAASDTYLSTLYPPESNHAADLDALGAETARFLVARRDGAALGCGAILLDGDGCAEIKRLWIAESARGLGLGRRLLAALEEVARTEGVAVLRLETGVAQPEALGLYRAAGYVEIPPFGSYCPDPVSVFMEKRLE